MSNVEYLKRDIERIENDFDEYERLKRNIREVANACHNLQEKNHKHGTNLLKENNSVGEHYISEGNNYNTFYSTLIRLLNGDSINEIIDFLNIPYLKPREIHIFDYFNQHHDINNLDILYDLIKADLVEKIEE